MDAEFSTEVRFYRLSEALQPYFTALYATSIECAWSSVMGVRGRTVIYAAAVVWPSAGGRAERDLTPLLRRWATRIGCACSVSGAVP